MQCYGGRIKEEEEEGEEKEKYGMDGLISSQFIYWFIEDIF
jgi:hypothetical protein